MNLTDIRQDKKYWQRLLRLAGYYKGAIDGIHGPQTTAATSTWEAAATAAGMRHGWFDTRTETNLATLLPELQAAARAWLAHAVAGWQTRTGYTVKLIQGTRSYAEQNALYAQGRTAPGRRVTNARGGYSNHNFGIAFDIGIFTPAGQYLDDVDKNADATYRNLYERCGAPAGCEWGGNWKSITDMPHYQLSRWGSGTSKLRSIF